MTSSFVAYIDESGDEGFTFRDNGSGSSRWFVLTAVIFRKSGDATAVHALRKARQTLKWEAKKSFHFSEMRHEQRLVLLHEIAQLNTRTVSIISYKPDIPNPEHYQANKCLLYRYLTRLLLERVSWLCRDKKIDGQGDGSVDLIFSDRASMSYVDLRNYIELLRKQSLLNTNIQIHWPAVVTEKIRAVAHNQMSGLQIADAVATSVFYGIRLSRLGISDPSYMVLLRELAYQHKKSRFGYGVKFLSNFQDLKKQMPHLNAAFENW
ncbi:DUF3800 domain-containing protein [Variovorax paradoxus]|uniref:DUF3800 domain-containing protein n=1 Tax=Variovorax paradoxus TaxID=34073 RepID=UPI0009BF5DFC|nr:DUF3800 domain-containing protein [Variovorax paradoxus]